MKLSQDANGFLTSNYPKTFYRLTNWMSGCFVADYSTEAEAVKASFASKNGTKYDHKISKMHLSTCR